MVGMLGGRPTVCSAMPRKPNSIWYPIHSAVEVFGLQVDIRPQAMAVVAPPNTANGR